MKLNCVNCDLPIPEQKPPYLYCSDSCRQEADFVCYARAVTRDGRIDRPDVLEALRIRRAWVLVGGYPGKILAVQEEVRTGVFERNGKRCVFCGRTATDIDHHRTDPSTDVNDPINLRGLCAECHRQKSLSNLRPIDPETQPHLVRKARELDSRIQAPVPTRVSDDEAKWKGLWRGIAKKRAEMIKAAEKK